MPRQHANRTRKVRCAFSTERSSRPLDGGAIERRTARQQRDPRHGSGTAAARRGQRLVTRKLPRQAAVLTRAKLPDRPWGVRFDGYKYPLHSVLGVKVPVKGSVDATDRLPPMRKHQVSITWLTKYFRDHYESHPLTEESSEDEKERYARVYLIGMIGGVFFSKKSSNLLRCGWLRIILGSWEEIGEYSWASACLANIYHNCAMRL
ncbi:unnamed protein product [Linum trigynum]|uniref:Aminotransferase-like plant mobile domain-containing protein n=1 Tax=Linum trigynum TaxID=586398 RepID=A0AAV2GP24_9ROSI